MRTDLIMGWVAYGVAWLAAALFWTLASATGASRSPAETLPYGLLAMGSAGLMGVGVWQITGRVSWNGRSIAFYAIHAGAIVLYSAIYSSYWVWLDLVNGRFEQVAVGLRTSPVQNWNLLMGSWLYLMVAGLSYAVRANRQIRTQEAAAAQARQLAQQAQLAALRAQINPHFLFNALHSVGALITSDPVRADAALERLGDLLRYALGAEDEVPFQREWRFVEDYLAFEELRLGDRLHVDARVDDEARAILVPPLILQPLVENAVRHGIADRPSGGRIELRASVGRGRLRLTVANDGAGDGDRGGLGLGMDSVRQRLAALYGDEASLQVDRTAAGFLVAMTLPLGHGDDARPAP